MPEYRRTYRPGGTFFFTLVTHRRRPLFRDPDAVESLRLCLREVRAEGSFEIVAGVVLPDHLHWMWTLPEGDADFSVRIGRVKAMFTRSLRAARKMVGGAHPTSASRIKHREGDVWQRRFWEHVIRDQDDFNQHLDYVHYNPVKHGLSACPHAYPASSFGKWVRGGAYAADWLCTCDGRRPNAPVFPRVNYDMFE